MFDRVRLWFAWKTTYKNHSWTQKTNTITGHVKWIRHGVGYSPIPTFNIPSDAPPPPPKG